MVRAVGRTLRLHVTDQAGFFSGQCPGPVIFSYWHNRMLAVAIIYLRRYPPMVRRGERKGAVVLISRNQDARLIGSVMQRFGIGVVSGSSSRGGAAALLELADCIRNGLDVNMTPDGPRGPRYRAQPGFIYLAQKTGAPVLPIHIEYGRCLRFNSWDGFMVPLPFSRVKLTFGRLEHIAPTLTEAQFDAERRRIENLMQPSPRSL